MKTHEKNSRKIVIFQILEFTQQTAHLPTHY